MTKGKKYYINNIKINKIMISIKENQVKLNFSFYYIYLILLLLSFGKSDNLTYYIALFFVLLPLHIYGNFYYTKKYDKYKFLYYNGKIS